MPPMPTTHFIFISIQTHTGLYLIAVVMAFFDVLWLISNEKHVVLI